jgi:CHAT domain-containing protein
MEESQAVAHLLGSTPLTGKSATKKAVLERVERADIIYLATHGMAHPNRPLDGFLALSGAPQPDGIWTAKEIQSCRLEADLVVLSACQTGLGGIHDAGVIGVARGFQIAGAKWVVMSLWSVDDRFTSQLMQSFVAELLSAQTIEQCLPAGALRKAMLSMRHTNGDPKAWAPFVVFGVPWF